MRNRPSWSPCASLPWVHLRSDCDSRLEWGTIARLLAVATLAFMTGCTQLPAGPSVAPTATGAARGVVAYTLLTTGHLLVVSLDDGKILRDLALASSSPQLLTTVHAMALTADGATMYVLAQDATRTGRVAAVDVASQQILRTIEVGTGADYRSLDVGQRSGLLYVFGNQGGAALVWIVDPTGRAPARQLLARPADGRTWFVYQGLVKADESALFISYHGPDTGGIDRFDLKDGSFVRCPQGPYPNAGCLDGHGSMRFIGDRLMVTTGDVPLLALDPMTGAVAERYDSGIEANHLMEFGVDPTQQRLYVVGSCGYAPGLATIDLPRRLTQVLAPRHYDSPCGERIAVTPNGDRLVVAQTEQPVPTGALSGKLVILSNTGSELRQIRLPAEPIDLLVVR